MSESSPQNRSRAAGKASSPEREETGGEFASLVGTMPAGDSPSQAGDEPAGESLPRDDDHASASQSPQADEHLANGPSPQNEGTAPNEPAPQGKSRIESVSRDAADAPSGVADGPSHSADAPDSVAGGPSHSADAPNSVADGPSRAADKPGAQPDRAKRGKRAVGAITLCRRLARALLVVLVLALMNDWQIYSYAHEGLYPFGASVGEVTLVFIAMLVLGNALITYVSARAEHGTRARHDMPRPDSETSTYDELKGLIPFSKFTGPVLGMAAVWFFASMCSCDRLGATRENTGILLAIIPVSAVAFVLLELIAAWISEATQRAYGWSEESKSRFQALEKEAREAWEREHPEEVARALAEEARKLEEAERKKREEAEKKAQAERFYAASAGVRRRAAMQASREAAAKRAHKKNPALCPKCGSADVVVLEGDFKPSLIGAALGSSHGFLGAAAGAALLGNQHTELMCRRCGARWRLK